MELRLCAGEHRTVPEEWNSCHSSQPAALPACHGLMISLGTWQPQPDTWHSQPATQTPTWDCHWFSCQPEIRSCGGHRPRVPGGQRWEQGSGPAKSPGSFILQGGNALSLLCKPPQEVMKTDRELVPGLQTHPPDPFCPKSSSCCRPLGWGGCQDKKLSSWQEGSPELLPHIFRDPCCDPKHRRIWVMKDKVPRLDLHIWGLQIIKEHSPPGVEVNRFQEGSERFRTA